MKVTNNTKGDRVYPSLGVTLKAGESYDTEKKLEKAKPVVAAEVKEPKPEPTSSAAPDLTVGE